MNPFAEANRVPLIRFGKYDRKTGMTRGDMRAQEGVGRSGVVGIGAAQEYENNFSPPNGKRQATHAGIAFTKLPNGFAAWEDPWTLQELCGRFGPGIMKAIPTLARRATAAADRSHLSSRWPCW